jgi:hypothetical protein
LRPGGAMEHRQQDEQEPPGPLHRG